MVSVLLLQLATAAPVKRSTQSKVRSAATRGSGRCRFGLENKSSLPRFIIVTLDKYKAINSSALGRADPIISNYDRNIILNCGGKQIDYNTSVKLTLY